MVLSSAIRLLAGVDLRPLKDPTSLSLENLPLERLPMWMKRLLLSEARLRQVRHVVVSDCTGVTDAQLALLCVGAPHLVSLTASGCHEMSADQLQAQDLTALTLINCGVTDASASAMGRSCPQLLELALLQCPRLRAPTIASATLTSISLQGCAELLDAAVASLCAGCPRLESLDLSECRALTRPRPSGAELRKLRLEECSGLASGALEALSELPGLTALSLAYCRQLGLGELINEGGGEGGGEGESGGDGGADWRVPWPPSLRKLDVASCGAWFDDAAAAWLRERCACIEELRLSGCTGLVAPPLGSSSLRSLELVGCDAITADAVHAALRRSPDLRSLDIRGCDTVGEDLGANALEVPDGLLTRLSLTAEPALEALFFSAAARASAEEEDDEEEQVEGEQQLQRPPSRHLQQAQDADAARGDG